MKEPVAQNQPVKNLWILQGLDFVEKSENLEPVEKRDSVNFKILEKTYEKTWTK